MTAILPNNKAEGIPKIFQTVSNQSTPFNYMKEQEKNNQLQVYYHF